MKYAHMLNDSLASVLIPVGMSFYSFRNISYLIDVYKGEQADTNIIDYINYSLFFPSFSAGPIDRHSDLGPQMKTLSESFDISLATKGLFLFIWGLYKKNIVAEHMSYYTEWVYNSIQNYSGFTLLLVGFFYSVQIYCDFSGYSDMAIGAANLLGFDIKSNFKHPYLATSISDFWRRWHISLSKWLRDYIYIPLGGGRCGFVRKRINILVTFLVSGIWHGVGINYILWGVFHGFASLVKRNIKLNESTGVKVFKGLTTFVYVNFAWVLFRLNTMKDIIYYFTHVFDGISKPIQYMWCAQQALHMDYLTLLRIFLLIAIVFIYDVIDEIKKIPEIVVGLHSSRRIVLYLVMIIVIYSSLPVAVAKDYIYFQF